MVVHDSYVLHVSHSVSVDCAAHTDSLSVATRMASFVFAQHTWKINFHIHSMRGSVRVCLDTWLCVGFFF